MNPKFVFIYPIGVILIFYPEILQNDVTANLIKVGSIILLTPLAYLFGLQFRRNEEEADEILETKEREVSAADEIAKDVGEVIDSAKGKLSPEEMEKLNEILEETQDLREEKPKKTTPK